MRDELIYVLPAEVIGPDADAKPSPLFRMVKMWERLSEDERRQFRRHIDGVLPISTESELVPTVEASRILGTTFYKVKQMVESGELSPEKVKRDYFGKVTGYLFRRSAVEQLKESRGERTHPQRKEPVVPEEDWDALPPFNYDSFLCVVAGRAGAWKRHPVWWAGVLENINGAACREAVDALLLALTPVEHFLVQYAFRKQSESKTAKRLGITHYRVGGLSWKAKKGAVEVAAQYPPLDTLKVDIEGVATRFGCDDARTAEQYDAGFQHGGEWRPWMRNVRRCRLCGHDSRDVLSLYCPAKFPGKGKVRRGAIAKQLDVIEWAEEAARPL
jgi:hypothetical protein